MRYSIDIIQSNFFFLLRYSLIPHKVILSEVGVTSEKNTASIFCHTLEVQYKIRTIIIVQANNISADHTKPHIIQSPPRHVRRRSIKMYRRYLH